MPSDGSWRTLGKIANIIGIVWALAALSLLGYFASLGVAVVRHSG